MAIILIIVGIICLPYILAIFLYKEKFTVRQYIGAAIGVASMVLINLK